MDVWLLGNGFDLSHKLPTKYENFIRTMEFLINHDTNIKSYKTIGDIFGSEELRNKDSFISGSYEVYSEFYNKIPARIDIGLVEKAKENYWLNYFMKGFKIDAGWIDFEKEIANVINRFKEFLTNKKLWEESATFFSFDDLDVEQKNIFECFNFFFEISEYYANNSLFNEPILNASSVLKYCIIKEDFLISKPHGSDNKIIDKEKISKFLFDSLLKFSFLLRQYLNIFVESLLSSINSDYALFSEIKDAYEIVSFNYTQTVEKIYGKEDVCHIHGEDRDCYDIVLGINSDTDDNIESVDTLFLDFKKYYQRVFFNTDYKYLTAISKISRNLKMRNRYGDLVNLNIVGHSLDITDEDIIREMFEIADEITIFYHKDNIIGNYIKNLVKLYGRKGFDELRKVKKLKFKSTRMHS